MVVLAERYINDRYLPDKAIDLLDEACACAALRNKKLEEYDAKELALRKEKNHEQDLQNPAGGMVDYEELAKTHYRIATLEESLDKLKSEGAFAAGGGEGPGQGHRAVDRHPRRPGAGKRAGQAGPPGGRALPEDHRPGRGGEGRLRRGAPQPGADQPPAGTPPPSSSWGPQAPAKPSWCGCSPRSCSTPPRP